VREGEFCVILGPSGAGKSTLLRLVNGLLQPFEGTIRFKGIEIGPKTYKQIRPRIGMIHQQFNLSGRLTVLDNVLCGALPEVSFFRAMTGSFPNDLRRIACQRLHEVGLGEEHLFRKAASLSGGQQQRVGFARAFILNPDLILADEPVASLDPRISGEILALLKRDSLRGASSVLCSLHQVTLARTFADRIIGIRAGQKVFDGPPSALTKTALRDIYGADSDQEGYAMRGENISGIVRTQAAEETDHLTEAKLL